MSYWDSTELESEVCCLTVEEIIEDINEETLICFVLKITHAPE